MNLSGTLTRSSSVADVAEALGLAALALTDGSRGAVYLHAPDGETTCLWASQDSLRERRGPSESGPILVSDVRALPQDHEIRRVAEREDYRALAAWPLSQAGKTIGSVVCCFDAPRSWSAAEVDVMSALALQGAAALERALRSERSDGSQGDAGAEDDRIAEALRILQSESTELFETHRELEAQHARLVRARRELGALSVWLLAVRNELHGERTRLAAEQLQVLKAREELASEDARVAAARDALDAQITAARHELDKEIARLAQMRQTLFENRGRQTEARRDPATDRASLSDARRILEEESARLMRVLEADATPPAETLPVRQPVTPPAEPPAAPAPPSIGKATPLTTPAALRESSTGIREAVSPRAADSPASSTNVRAPVSAKADGSTQTFAYELGGPLPTPQALEELYPLLVERAAKLLNQERRSLKAEEEVKVLGRALDDRDGHRAGYSERLEAWAEATAGLLGCRGEDVADVRRAALLHDLGKIGVPEAILRATRRLTEQQRQVVRSVPTLAEQVLQPVKGMQGVAAILRHRYEQWDGKGYPDGLKGDQIPLGARILAVVDAYGVMTTVRPYRAMVYSLDAVAELRRCAGAQFDPKVVEAFCDILKRAG